MLIAHWLWRLTWRRVTKLKGILYNLSGMYSNSAQDVAAIGLRQAVGSDRNLQDNPVDDLTCRLPVEAF